MDNFSKIFNTEEQALINNIKVEHENLVAKWLQNSFKIEENTALDLRATPLSLQIPPMTEVNNRPVFKMNNDFWNQARGPPQMMAQNLSNFEQNFTANVKPNPNQNSPVPGSANSIPAHSPSQHSTSSQNQMTMQQQNQNPQNQQNQQLQQPQQSNTPNSHPQTPQNAQQMTPNSQMSQQSNHQQQQQQQPQNNGQNQQLTPQMGSPNTQHHNLQAAHAHALAQQHLAQMTQHHLGSGQNSPEKLHEKLVNDIQVRAFSLFGVTIIFEKCPCSTTLKDESRAFFDVSLNFALFYSQWFNLLLLFLSYVSTETKIQNKYFRLFMATYRVKK